jgi:tRNA pseudouridine(55) synthase
MEFKNVLYLQKEKGETPLACMERFRARNPEYKDLPMTYAGRLDPIATGELLVLAGEECKKKDDYLSFDKEYEATVLLGYKTDSFDILGLPQKTETVEKDLSSFVGKFTQTYPPYSSKTVNGKQLHEYARAGEIDTIELPTKEVEIKTIENVSFEEVSGEDLLEEIISTVDSVEGDFRQEEIKNAWKDQIDINLMYKLVSFKTLVSSGTYIRGIADRLGGALLRLHRTKIYDK